MQTGGGWILELDIRKLFDELDHAHLQEFLQHRVRDGVLLRCRAAPNTVPEATPSLRVLRDHERRAGVVAIPTRSVPHLAQMALPPSA